MTEPNPSRVLRRALEEALEKHIASTVLFEALGAAGNVVPQSSEDVLRVVRGPLREVLSRRLETDAAAGLLARIEELLVPVEPATLELSLDELVDETRGGPDATVLTPTEDRAVHVIVLAATQGFSARLQMTLGEARVAAVWAKDAARFKELIAKRAPAIVLVDGTDVPRVDARELLRIFAPLPVTTARVVWGAGLPYARSVAELLGEDRAGWVILDLDEGISPLIDLVRSRRAGPSRETRE